jgi:alpha-beta hydrolase superfamily lysophospholipase
MGKAPRRGAGQAALGVPGLFYGRLHLWGDVLRRFNHFALFALIGVTKESQLAFVNTALCQVNGRSDLFGLHPEVARHGVGAFAADIQIPVDLLQGRNDTRICRRALGKKLLFMNRCQSGLYGKIIS